MHVKFLPKIRPPRLLGWRVSPARMAGVGRKDAKRFFKLSQKYQITLKNKANADAKAQHTRSM
jgi:hypothetical protein